MENAVQRHSTPFLLIAGLAVLVLLAQYFGGPLLARVATGALISVVLVVGIWVFVGNSGILSFGHLGFSAIAAYATAWLTMRVQMKQMILPGLPEWLLNAAWDPNAAIVASAAFAAAIALLIGLLLMRLTGVAAAISTLAFMAIVRTVIANSDTITGGVGSLAGIPGRLDLLSVLGWAALAIGLAHVYSASGWGLALRALREDSVAAEAVGINGYASRLAAFVLSAFIAGMAGSLQARFLGVISPDSFYIPATVVALTMLIVGGMFSLSGAVLGVVVISVLTDALIRFEGAPLGLGTSILIPAGTANFVIAVLMCVMLVKRPRGLLGHREITIPAGILPTRSTVVERSNAKANATQE